MQVEFTAKWNRDIYRTDEYAVSVFYDDSTDTSYKCVGSCVPSTKNIRFDITAECRPDEKYGGNKYEVISAVPAPCNDKKSIIDYLSSGFFKGVGRKTAERIYSRFKDSAIYIIENEPHRLTEVKGISIEKARLISQSCHYNQIERETYQYLSKFGFTTKQVHAIKELSPVSELLDYVKSNPYEMIKIHGVTFAMADLVAGDNLIPKDDINRVSAASEQIIKDMMLRGHTGCEYLPLAQSLIKMLNTDKVNAGNVRNYILDLIKHNRLGYRRVKTLDNKEVFYVYLLPALEAENELAEYIKKNMERQTKFNVSGIDKLIEKESKDIGVLLDCSQINAIKNALNNNMSVITGGPGTGKTTIINIIANIWEKTMGSNIVLMSPTGRAARRMAEATGRHAATIHSTLRLGLTDESGLRDEMSDENCIEDSLVIIDECSMIDVFLARDTMSLLKNCTIVLVGDSDQLPSVGSGKVLEDIIKSDRVPVAELKYSHRQNLGSTICTNAERIKNGVCDLKVSPDFTMIIKKSSGRYFDDTVFGQLEDVMVREYKKLVDEYGIENVAVLCPFNKHKAGQLSLNNRLQELMNPYNGSREFKGKNGQTFRHGDPVMQLVNSEDVSNGDIGTVIAIDKVDGIETLVVKFYDCVKSYTRESSEDIALAYAMTVHKSQGSEYDAVVTCLMDAHGSMIKRNILYTAITRAKKKVVFCGTGTALKAAIANDRTETRNTLLCHNLKDKIYKEEKIKPIQQPRYVQQRFSW